MHPSRMALRTMFRKCFSQQMRRASTLGGSRGGGLVPVIDISAKTLEEKKRVAKAIGRACEEIGFFSIVGHDFSPALIQRTWDATKAFFDLPHEEKMKVKMTADYPYGYEAAENLAAGYGTDGMPDMKETFCVGPYNPASGMPPVQWPQRPSNLQSEVHAYYQEMERLADRLLTYFALALDLPENWFADKTDRHRSALRALNYPKMEKPPAPGQVRAGQHTDYGTLTILKQDGVGGLQVMNRQKEWQDVAPVKDAFVINIGDLMAYWTNDKWVSTLHRVVIPPNERHSNTSQQRRQSIAFFQNINPDCVVECIPTCKGPNNPPKYPVITAWEHLLMKHSAATKEVK